MQEVFLNRNNLAEVAQQAVAVLTKGGVIVYPTETAYGLGADYFSDSAVAKIYAIKQREVAKALPVIVATLEAAEQIVIFDDQARQIVAQYWPGALTVVLPHKLAGQKKHFSDTLGLRISSNAFCQALTGLFANPIVSTSANISGKGAIYSVEQIKEQFSKLAIQPDLFINVGNLPVTPASTIIKSVSGKIEILRQGEIVI
jgi:L-threonylcarbamoyladenylate synthase